MECLFLYDAGRHVFRLLPGTVFAAILACATPTCAGDWVIETVDAAGDVGTGSSLALDDAGLPHVSYRDETNQDLKYVFMDTAGWHFELVDTAGDVGYNSSLDLDASGVAHVSYGADGTMELRYACKADTVWATETIVSWGAMVAACHSLAADRDGCPHVAWYHWGDPANYLNHKWRDSGGSWHNETFAFSYGYLQGVSLVLDGVGYPHASYCDTYHDQVWYAHKDQTGWHHELVDHQLGLVGWSCFTSCALGYLERPHISYYDVTSGDLRYASADPSGWHLAVVDSLGNVGRFASLALDALGCPHISYEDATNQDLKYAYRDASGWHIEVVDSVRSVGAWCSLALDLYGRPHISYYDATNGALKYAVGQASAMYLAGEPDAGQLRLTWNPWPKAAGYWVYGASNLTYFTPGLAPGYQHRLAVLSSLFLTWSSPNGIGDPNDNWTYLVLAVDNAEQELCRSNRVGEWDFAVEPPQEPNAPDWPVRH